METGPPYWKIPALPVVSVWFYWNIRYAIGNYPNLLDNIRSLLDVFANLLDKIDILMDKITSLMEFFLFYWTVSPFYWNFYPPIGQLLRFIGILTAVIHKKAGTKTMFTQKKIEQ